MRSTSSVLSDAFVLGIVLCGAAAASCARQTAMAGSGGSGVDSDAAVDEPDAQDDASIPDGSLANGDPCLAATACTSGFCVDGVCCEHECAGTCQSCALPDSAGICLAAEVGTDPREDCPDEGVSSCGRDGQCDGSGACRRYPVGVICRAPSCLESTRTNASRCGADGVCRPTSGQPCEPYRCNASGTDCLVTCTDSSDCLAGTVCDNGSCGQKPLGAACVLGNECNSLICQQGVCCNSLCSGTCRSCAVAGASGTCTGVPAGEDPLDQCADSGAASCATDGACNGAGACRLYGAATVCAAGSCPTGATRTPPRQCNGTGTCVAAASSSTCPGAFLCDAANNVCKSSCTVATSAADCVAPNVCTGIVCSTLKLQYQSWGTPTATTQSPHPQFKIINLGAANIALSDLTIRYWYTADGAQAQAAAVDFAANSANVQIKADVTAVFTPVVRTGADTFMQLGFLTAAGTLTANGGTTVVQSRFNSLTPPFGITYVQTNDYSFDATKTAYADWTHITLYQRGVLVSGIEPPP